MPDLSKSEGTDSTRRKLLAALGGSATVGLAGCTGMLGEDDEEGNGNGGNGNGGNGNGGNGNGNGGNGNGGEGDEDPRALDVSNADKAQAAWNRVRDNPEPTDEAEEIRNESYVEIEEAARDDMVLLPMFHTINELFWWDYVDLPHSGALGHYLIKHTETEVEGDDELNMIVATFDELDPIMSTDTSSTEVIRQMYEGLTQYPDGIPEVENDLLEDFEVSEDDLTWTFEIKEGVEFHDGRELTADDVVYSWRRTAESEHSERRNFTLAQPNGLGLAHEAQEDHDGAGDDGTGMTVIDDYTFEIELISPNPDVLDILTYTSFSVIPEGLVGDIDGYDGEITHEELQEEVVVGTGPFTLDFFDVNENVRVEAFENYHGSQPNVNSIHWFISENAEANWTYGAIEGNADVFPVPTQYYDPGAIDAEEDDMGRQVGTYGPAGDLEEEVNYLAVPELSTQYFGFNVSNTEKAARQAVAYVFDQEELVQEVFEGRNEEAYSFLPPDMWPTGQDGFDEWMEEYPYAANETDLDAARAVLEEAGHTEDDPLQMQLTIGQSPVVQEVAELIADKLRGTALDLELDQTEFSIMQGRGEDGDLEMYQLGWSSSWVSPAYWHFGLEPLNTDTSGMPNETTGYYLDWHTELEDEG